MIYLISPGRHPNKFVTQARVQAEAMFVSKQLRDKALVYFAPNIYEYFTDQMTGAEFSKQTPWELHRIHMMDTTPIAHVLQLPGWQYDERLQSDVKCFREVLLYSFSEISPLLFGSTVTMLNRWEEK